MFENINGMLDKDRIARMKDNFEELKAKASADVKEVMQLSEAIGYATALLEMAQWGRALASERREVCHLSLLMFAEAQASKLNEKIKKDLKGDY